MFPQLARRRTGGNSRIGCILDLPLRYLEGSSFMSRDVYGHLCTNYGSKWQLDGRYFDGNKRYIATPLIADVGIGDFSLEMLVKPEVLAGDHRVLFVNRTLGTFQHSLDNGGLNAKMIAWYASSSGGVNLLSSALSWILGNHYYLTWFRLGLMMQMYHNTLQALSATSQPANVTATTTMDIGYRVSPAQHPWHGTISRVRFHRFTEYVPRVLERVIEGRRR